LYSSEALSFVRDLLMAAYSASLAAFLVT
jgi:hypothetical protein